MKRAQRACIVSMAMFGPIERRAIGAMLIAIVFAAAVFLTACEHRVPDAGAGSYAAVNRADCLPGLNLLDQHGRTVPLPSLKGRAVLIDFIYTSCPGPCEMLTSRMKRIARDLNPELRSHLRLVTVSIDPEHDRPERLLKYAEDRGAGQGDWLFLTGTPDQIDYLLALFGTRREKAPDGSIGHVVEMFLLGPDGRQVRQYNPQRLKPGTVASDLRRILKIS